jgi:hypothetical protein
MYPYVDQLLRWRSDDADRRVGGPVMEVKGDFCRQVRAILVQTQRSDDFVEIGLDTGVCYNPLHNDLDPYAVAYVIATLLNNLFGKSKEPFWQQAYTDLLKFVILLRRLTGGYTTFAEVYRYVLDNTQIDRAIRRDGEQETYLDAQWSRTVCSARRARAGGRGSTSSRPLNAGMTTDGAGSTRACARDSTYPTRRG